MRITIPENISEITLGQYQSYDELLSRKDLNKKDILIRTVKIFTGIKTEIVMNMSIDDLQDTVSLIDKALSTDSPFKQFFKIGTVEFGFIPNFDKLKAKEYFDLSEYKNEVKELNKLMSILYRPISNRDKLGNYSIIDYQGTDEWSDAMKLTPLNVVNGALDFFLRLSKICMIHTQKYLSQEQAKEVQQQTTLKSGDGMQPLMT